MSQWFATVAASRAANLTLLLEVIMALVLIAGAVLARKQKFRSHAFCQSSVVLLNLLIIAGVMFPSFWQNVSPKIPGKLDRSYYSLATAHAALGTIAEAGALYILVAAGTKWLPERLRLQRYKLWMRILLATWWLLLFLGFATYLRWYVPHAASR